MTIKEFTDRTNIIPTDEEYQVIEKMYYDCGNLDKDEFCKDYKEHHDSIILNELFNKESKMSEELEKLRKERSEMVDFLLVRAQEFGDIKLLNQAITMAGHSEVIKRKIILDLNLWDIDKEYIKNHIK